MARSVCIYFLLDRGFFAFFETFLRFFLYLKTVFVCMYVFHGKTQIKNVFLCMKILLSACIYKDFWLFFIIFSLHYAINKHPPLLTHKKQNFSAIMKIHCSKLQSTAALVLVSCPQKSEKKFYKIVQKCSILQVYQSLSLRFQFQNHCAKVFLSSQSKHNKCYHVIVIWGYHHHNHRIYLILVQPLKLY